MADMSAGAPVAHDVDRSKLRVPKVEGPPAVAWPTVLLWAGAFALWTGSTVAGLSGAMPVAAMIALNAAASFMMFTVAHESTHNAAGTGHWVNPLLGRISVPFVATYISYPALRFIHMQHHRFTNEAPSMDPDAYVSHGPVWQLLLRWITVDGAYLRFYVPRLGDRPAAERRETVALVLASVVLYAVLIATGNGLELLVACLIPQRIALGVLAWWFDWLPHHGLERTAAEDRYRATRNRIGLEPILSPLMLNQNYHLVHHLHPRIPFYRYVSTWRAREDEYLVNDPALASVTGRELTAAELRARREPST